MLPVQSRIRTRDEYARLNRSGRRARSGPVVVHSLSTGEDKPVRAGFVVGRKVGKAVVRNRVRRRLREQARVRLSGIEPGTLILVRALPDAAAATSAELGRALDTALRRLGGGTARSAPTSIPRSASNRCGGLQLGTGPAGPQGPG